MRKLLRILAIAAATVGALVGVLALYLIFGDLRRHKGTIESYLTQQIGRPFAIDGSFVLDLYPTIKVEAEKVRIGNAPWGSTPQMIQVGRIAIEIDPWTLVSHPVDVRSLELRDVTVVLERNRDGEGNWTFGRPEAAQTAGINKDSSLKKLPVAFRYAALSNLSVTSHVPGEPDRIANIESLIIQPGAAGLLDLNASGAMDGYQATLQGKAGPLQSLLTGRNISVDLDGGFGNLRFSAKGGLGRLNPLDGTDLKVSIRNPDLGTMLRNLRLPAVATGKLDVDFSLKDAGERTDLQLTAQAGDLLLQTSGKLALLGLHNSDLSFKGEAADAARLARVFGIEDVPEARLAISGRLITRNHASTFEGIHATLGGYEAKLDGTIPQRRNRARQLRFSVTVPRLADLMATLPAAPMSVRGEVEYKPAPRKPAGLMQALLSSRDIQLDLTGALGNSKFTAKGEVGQLDPMAGADLAISISNPDGAAFLENLKLPAIGSGELGIDATLKSAGKLAALDLTARLGDISIQTAGSLTTLALRDSDLTFQAVAPDAARLANAFDVSGVPAAKLSVTGHLVTTSTEYRLDDVHATLGAYDAHFDGAIPAKRHVGGVTSLRFDAAIPTLEILNSGLPPMPLKISGAVVQQKEKIELKDLVARFGESQLKGSVTLTGTKHEQIGAELDAPLLDVTPFLREKAQPEAQPAAKTDPKHFLFGEQPIPYARLGTRKIDLHFTSAEIRLESGVLHGVDSKLTLDEGQLHAKMQASGGYGGSIGGSIDVTPTDNGSATIKLNVDVQNVRAGLTSGDGVPPKETPPTNLKLALTSSGATPRQLASVANGTIVLTQGPGKSANNMLNRIGNDILNQLISKLNPFSKQDPFTQVDCSVARLDITDGKAVVDPILMQTRKVAIVAHGHVDLKTEKLSLNFTTQPRKGIGISAGMFANPFLDLTGTLAHPSIGVGGKGVTSGAVAVATGGLSVLAKGAVDRAIGETDQCKEALAKAQAPPH